MKFKIKTMVIVVVIIIIIILIIIIIIIYQTNKQIKKLENITIHTLFFIQLLHLKLLAGEGKKIQCMYCSPKEAQMKL